MPALNPKMCAIEQTRLDVRRVGLNESSSMDAVLRRLQKEFTQSEVAEAGAPSIVATASKPEFPVLKPEYRKIWILRSIEIARRACEDARCGLGTARGRRLRDRDRKRVTQSAQYNRVYFGPASAIPLAPDLTPLTNPSGLPKTR